MDSFSLSALQKSKELNFLRVLNPNPKKILLNPLLVTTIDEKGRRVVSRRSISRLSFCQLRIQMSVRIKLVAKPKMKSLCLVDHYSFVFAISLDVFTKSLHLNG